MDTKIKIKIDTVKVINEFLSITKNFKSDINLLYGRYIIDAKSTLGVFSINPSELIYVEIISDDEEEIEKFNEAMKSFKIE